LNITFEVRSFNRFEASAYNAQIFILGSRVTLATPSFRAILRGYMFRLAGNMQVNSDVRSFNCIGAIAFNVRCTPTHRQTYRQTHIRWEHYRRRSLRSIDIWHLFGLISWISGLLYGFFFVSVFF